MGELLELTAEKIQGAIDAPIVRATLTADHPLIRQKQQMAEEMTKGTVIGAHGLRVEPNSPCNQTQVPLDVRFVPTTGFFENLDGKIGPLKNVEGLVVCTAACCNHRFAFYETVGDAGEWLPMA